MISQAGPLLSSHLEALSSNCRALQNFRFIGFKVEDTNILKNVRKDFKNLKALDICMYDCDEESSSSDDDDDEEESGVGGRSNIEVVLFFMESAVNLEVRNFENIKQSFSQDVKLHMNFGSHLNYAFLTSLLDKNPLQLTSHLHISRLASHLEKWQNRTNVVLLINLYNPQPKDCASWRGGDEDGLVENASADQPQSEEKY